MPCSGAARPPLAADAGEKGRRCGRPVCGGRGVAFVRMTRGRPVGPAGFGLDARLTDGGSGSQKAAIGCVRGVGKALVAWSTALIRHPRPNNAGPSITPPDLRFAGGGGVRLTDMVGVGKGGVTNQRSGCNGPAPKKPDLVCCAGLGWASSIGYSRRSVCGRGRRCRGCGRRCRSRRRACGRGWRCG